MTFIYFLISVVLFYYIFKFGVRLLMPFFFRKLAEKMMNGNSQGGFTQNRSRSQNPFERRNAHARPDGKVHVSYMPPKEKSERKGPQTAGEFIDFEEVK
ncbi:MAG TPA: DUF4834 family protein [Candidatus Sphingobacterium stercorigallinarum]|nr:DUF4834 family protein [Candidatus Sphingobacterium stercorigallinarum]